MADSPLFAGRLAALLVLFLLTACGGLPEPITRVMAPSEPKAIRRVALFPFSDSAANPRLALKAERLFLSELVRAKLFTVVPEGDVRLFFRRNRYYPGDAPDSRELQALRRQLGIDAIITGRVDEISPARGHNAGFVISLQVNLTDTETGEKLVATFLRRRGLDYQKIIHFGTITTASGLLRQMAREIFAQWAALGFSRPQTKTRSTAWRGRRMKLSAPAGKAAIFATAGNIFTDKRL